MEFSPQGRGGSEIQVVKQGLKGRKISTLVDKNVGNLYEDSNRFSDFKGKLETTSPSREVSSLSPKNQRMKG